MNHMKINYLMSAITILFMHNAQCGDLPRPMEQRLAETITEANNKLNKLKNSSLARSKQSDQVKTDYFKQLEAARKPVRDLIENIVNSNKMISEEVSKVLQSDYINYVIKHDLNELPSTLFSTANILEKSKISLRNQLINNLKMLNATGKNKKIILGAALGQSDINVYKTIFRTRDIAVWDKEYVSVALALLKAARSENLTEAQQQLLTNLSNALESVGSLNDSIEELQLKLKQKNNPKIAKRIFDTCCLAIQMFIDVDGFFPRVFIQPLADAIDYMIYGSVSIKRSAKEQKDLLDNLKRQLSTLAIVAQ